MDRAKLKDENCTAQAARLRESEIQELLGQFPDWSIEGPMVFRKYQFDDFRSAFSFVQAIAECAEEQQHHPEIRCCWGWAELRLSTHDAEGLTLNDFIIAARADELLVSRT